MSERSSVDWLILKTPLITISISVVTAFFLISLSYHFNNASEKEYQQNISSFRSITQRYLALDEEKRLLKENTQQFMNLYDKGVIGEEKRLDWRESLEDAHQIMGLQKLTYDIDEQKIYSPEYTVNYAGFELYRSSMKLNLGLLHEGDLFNFIDYMDEHANGIYTVTECQFRQKGNQVIFDKEHTNITAQCLLNWLTLDLPGERSIEM